MKVKLINKKIISIIVCLVLILTSTIISEAATKIKEKEHLARFYGIHTDYGA